MVGIIENAITEMSDTLGLPKEDAGRGRHREEVNLHFGKIARPEQSHTDPAWLQVVLTYQCPRHFRPVTNSLSANQLSWVNKNTTKNTLSDFDNVSQYILDNHTLEFS